MITVLGKDKAVIRLVPTGGTYAMSAGRRVILMAEEHDPAQLWLDLDTIFLFRCYEPPKPDPKAHRRKPPQRKSERIRVQTPMYVYTSEPQRVLPFVEHRKVTNNGIKRLIHLDFPGWERYEGKVCAFPYRVEDHVTLVRWCDENCRERYGFNKNMAYFESSDEACIARVAYGC